MKLNPQNDLLLVKEDGEILITNLKSNKVKLEQNISFILENPS